MTKIILSQDGSHTIESEQFGVTYHSKYGALQETQTVFLDAGLDHVASSDMDKITIFEMGFGTGLNAIMTLMEVADKKLNIDYHTIEAYPISLDESQKLNYPAVLEMSDAQIEAFSQMHASNSAERLQLADNFSFTKYIDKLENFSLPISCDLIYYDAFAPTSQENLWTPEMMEKLATFCNPNATLVTYCAKGSFKRALKSAGFSVEGIPGPIGKREMTRATLVE